MKNEEKKLTDEEVIEALKECQENGTAFYRYTNGINVYHMHISEIAFSLIHRLQSENKRFKKQVEQGLKDMKLEVGIRDKEIERLTEENEVKRAQVGLLENQVEFLKQYCDDLQERVDGLEKDNHDLSWIVKMHKYCVGADHCQNSSTREFELQKQVDNQKFNWNILCDWLGEEICKQEENEDIYTEVLDKVNEIKQYDTTLAKIKQQAVKDTAKEIWNRAYKTACNTRGEITEKSIKDQEKRYYGVEVE